MDKTLPRLAQASDLPQVLALAERANHGTTALQEIQNLRGSDFDLFVIQSDRDITGFLLMKKRLVRTITGDCESVIEDSFAVDASHHQSLIESAVAAARNYGSQFLTLEIAAQLSQERERFERQDFHLESHRISVATTLWPPPEGSPYTVRSPDVGDDFSIAILNSTLLEHTLCAGRDYDLSELTFRSMNSTLQQVNSQDPNSITLVLAQGSQLVGHLLLQIVDQSGYIYDLAVAREHWGGRATRQLMRAGSSLLFQRNVPLMVGDVSASNLRALKFAQRFLGFSVDRVRYGRRL
jgi:ribosomal protein S18 acetylase RimI-like enzyme